MSFDAQGFFGEVQYSLYFIALAFGVISMKSLPNPGSRRFSHMFNSKSYVALKFGSLVHFYLLFIYGIS